MQRNSCRASIGDEKNNSHGFIEIRVVAKLQSCINYQFGKIRVQVQLNLTQFYPSQPFQVKTISKVGTGYFVNRMRYRQQNWRKRVVESCCLFA
jgi:hypothetical protein